jgi:SMODS-associating 4TM effector domain
MASTGTSHPAMSEIGRTQDLDVNVRRQLAARRFYKQGKWLQFGGASFAVLLALVSPLVLLFRPSLGPTLGAIAGLWIFVSRLVLEPIKHKLQLKGATAQEVFDCEVLRLDWNGALARRIPEEEVRNASGSMRGAEQIKGWYPTANDLRWPRSVLICQRSNAVWSRRQHRSYGWLLVGAAIAWFVLGIVIAVADAATLTQYLTTVALPSLPALLDAAEMARGHWRAAETRQLLEGQVDALLEYGTATEQDLREIQDQLFTLRQDAPLVPEWFYKLIKPTYEADMRYAAERAAESDGHASAETGSSDGEDG